MEHDDLITLTADLVSAHVSNNDVGTDQLSHLIGSVYAALSGLGTKEEAVVAEKLSPAVSIRSSVKPDAVTCLECGFKGKMLKRHIGTEHGMTPQEYKARWGLPSDYPMVAPNYAAMRSEMASKIGLGRKPGQKRGRKKA